MKKSLILIVLLVFPLFAFAGHGKDGGWPQSIQLLKIAKQNLLDLLAQSSDQDVKDAINGMKDRTESIRVEDVDLATVIRLVRLVESPDVEQIEKSKYTGVRLFYYEDSNPENLRVYATKNFYNNSRYQVNPTEINAALLKEVQTLILHEISHLWGFGEENEEMNYARMFAVRMVNILHGSLKVNFIQREKLESLGKAFFFESIDIYASNAHNVLNGKKYSCVTLNEKGESASEITLNLNPFQHNLDGFPFQERDEALLRWTLDGFLMAETTEPSFGRETPISYFHKKKGVNRLAVEYTICHQDKKKLSEVTERFVRPYYSRSNLLTDYDNASLVVYQSLLIQDILFYGETFKAALAVSAANQKQLIQNIDYKIKVQHKEAWDRLTSRKYKYTKDKDQKDIDLINSLVNTDQSSEAKALWAQISNRGQSLNKQMRSMKNYNRAVQMDSFFHQFMNSFNEIVDRTSKFEEDIKFNSFACGKEKRLGDYYRCHIEMNKSDAQARLQMYEKMNTDMDALIKVYTNKANAIRD